MKHRRPRGLGGSGNVSILFALSLVPLLIAAALGVDTAFYVQANAQLWLTTDSAAVNAVRTSVADLLSGQTSAQASAGGATSGKQWFDAQLGTLPTGTITSRNVAVTFDSTTSTFTAVASFTGTVPTHIGRILNLSQWPISGSSTAVMTTASYVEVEMLIDNSPSMLIGATDSDIVAIERLTLCPPAATASNNSDQPLQASYAWSLPSNLGYNTSNGKATQTPPTSTPAGSCYSTFTGPSDQCFYPINPSTTNIKSNGLCPSGTGVYSSAYNGNVPNAPCAFACHTGDGQNDYYTLVRGASPKITLRFDVIQQAAQEVIQSLQTKEQVTNQFSIGVFEFNSAVTQVHPASASGFVESDYNLSQALTDVEAIETPVVSNGPDTNFVSAAAYLASNLTAAGNGLSPSTPRKNLFIITDGMEDASVNGTRTLGAMTNPANETECAPIKALGFSIYVLYTPFTPLPNPWYLDASNGVITAAEPASPDPPIVTALKACASMGANGTPQYYEASSQAEISAAMQAMLQSALNSPGRLSE